MIRPEITIEVTAEDIAIGTPGSMTCCPIARALCRQFGFTPNHSQHESSVIVEGSDFGIVPNPDSPDDFETYILPEEARSFIEAFDNYDETSPFTFTAKRWESTL